jgi:hypothetical protein
VNWRERPGEAAAIVGQAQTSTDRETGAAEAERRLTALLGQDAETAVAA